MIEAAATSKELKKPLVVHFADEPLSASDIISDDHEEEEYLYEEEYHPPLLPVLVLAFPILPFFWRYHVRVTPKYLSFGFNYGITTQKILKDDIVEVSPIDYVNGLIEWGGWGIRRNLSWETGYIAKNGPAIRIVTKTRNNKRKVFVFSCDDPKFVCELLTGGHSSAQWTVKIFN
jgi:hypothetical protein